MAPARPLPLDGVIRRYDWGSRTAIPRLLGVEPDDRPAAELWFGAHPDSPSLVEGAALDALITADPQTMLGTSVTTRFGPRLPYLIKVLAADRALSLQVHPTLEQARKGHAAEDAAGVPREAANRNYRDTNHKPELLCAMTPFEALCGFRPVSETLDLIGALGLSELEFVTAALHEADPLRTAVEAVLTVPDPAPLASAVARAAGPDGPLRGVWLAAHDFPGDAGVVLALLLNHVRLEPGEAMFLGAGNVHAYLRGTGTEVMASSDNVLRCGLTTKHVDVAEVLRVADFRELADPLLQPVDGAAATCTYSPPVPDFTLDLVDLDRGEIGAAGGPIIVLCAGGAAEVKTGGGSLELTPGHAAFVPPSDDGIVLRGSGTCYVARVND